KRVTRFLFGSKPSRSKCRCRPAHDSGCLAYVPIPGTALCFRRPGSLSTMLEGVVAYVTGARRRHTCFDGSIRLLPRFNTFEEILHVRNCSVAIATFVEHGILVTRDALSINREPSTRDFQCRLSPAELEAAVIDRRIHHALIYDIESGITKCGLNRVRTIPVLKSKFIGEHEGMFRLIRLHRPVNDVHPMGEQIGHRAADEVPE